VENFTDPIKIGFGHYLGRFHAGLIASTPAMQEFAARPFSQCAVWAPGRMIDQVEDMLASWRKNDNAGSERPRPYLPVIIAAMAKDYMPAPPEFSRVVPDDTFVTLPDDPLGRLFKLRMVVADVRTQVAIMAPEEPTARSIALQLDLFVKATENRSFYAPFTLAGMTEQWPVTLEMPELQAISVPIGDTKNMTILTVDIQARATVPLLRAPGPGEAHDGKGAGTPADPHGYPKVTEARGTNGPHPAYKRATKWTEIDQ
jgi:hypothetical protein